MVYHKHWFFHSLCLLLLFAIFPGTINNTAAAQEDSGSALYHAGEKAMAVLLQGKVKVPAERFPCANCHGKDGMGGREGATVIPPISWKYLSNSTTSRPAYSLESFRKVILSGIDANGENLGELMPKYEIESQTIVSLVDYLKALDFEQRKGITSRTIQLTPPENQDERLGFMEVIERFNNAGGSYGRTIVTEFEDQHFLAANSFSNMLKEKLEQAIQNKLLESVADDGVSIVALSIGAPSQATRHKLALAGIQYDESAQAMVVLNMQSADHLEIDRWLEQHRQAKSKVISNSNAPLRIYATASAVGSLTDKIMADQHVLVLVDLDESSVRWALSKGYSARAAAGFSMGSLLVEAILLSGRDPTRHAVVKLMNSFDLQERLFTWRSSR